VPYRPTKDIQTELQRLFFYGGALDGHYGPGTSQAEAQFQQTRWLEADGIHGLTSDGIMFPPEGAIFGVDYSWARPGGAMLQERGVNVAGRYLWAHEGNKGIGRVEYDDLVAHNISPYFFYETWAEDSMALGYDKGVEHAEEAQKFLNNLGLPNHPVHFNVDHQARDDQIPAILEGMRGAASVIGKARTGIYGQYTVVKAALDAGYVYTCQTYAWSGGKWDDRATLRQWSNGQWGGSVDFNWAMKEDFGQNPVT
jgi:peptidoglycan hydrolase-like protein with peptidoglycan-binding domain